jgi:hypothetical protein
MKTVIELDTYMQSRNYSYIRSQFHNNGDEYIREYMHKNGISTLRFENQGGVWINCF